MLLLDIIQLVTITLFINLYNVDVLVMIHEVDLIYAFKSLKFNETDNLSL